MVSIILPTYNRIEFLKIAVASILEQKFRDWELIIVDNSSIDGSKDYLKKLCQKDSRIKFISVKNRGSIAYSRNVGVKASTYNYISFIDSDDLWMSNKLFRIVKILKVRNPDFLFHGHKTNTFFGNIKSFFSNIYYSFYKFNFNNLLCDGNFVVTSTVIIKKNIFEQLSGFKTNLRFAGWEDYELWCRLFKSKAEVIYYPFRLTKRIVGEHNYSNKTNSVIILKNFKEYYLKTYPHKALPIWYYYQLLILSDKQTPKKEIFSFLHKIIFNISSIKGLFISIFCLTFILTNYSFKKKNDKP